MTEKKPLVLCIDDDPDILSYLEIVLEAEGFDFAGAASAEEGLLEYKKAVPDVIILDLMMEEVDAGTGFARELKLLDNEAPVFMLSSVGDNLSMTTDYAALGLAGIFQKPLEKDRLLAVLRAALPAVEATG
ncbi:MAG: response regulator [bacterium]|nr:response regulator [bacterium]